MSMAEATLLHYIIIYEYKSHYESKIRCPGHILPIEERVMTATPPTLASLTARLVEFRDKRDWKQFHSLKNLMLSLNLEAAELLEVAQWKSDAELDEIAGGAEIRQRLCEECADILLYLLLIAERTGIDLLAAADAKIDTNEQRYPVEKACGNSRKYTDL